MATIPVSSATHWWAVVLRGLAAIIFGILAFALPGITVAVLVILFGAYAFVDGIFAIIAAIRHQARGHTLWLLFEGIVGILAGLIAFFAPALAAFALLYVIAAWAIVTGIFEIVAAIRLRDVISNEWSLLLAGIISIIFGILLMIWPARGILTLVWLIGGFAIVFGILLIIAGFRMRGAAV
jgi:uncharacterized membrane protein HdeD (DUF308 family)